MLIRPVTNIGPVERLAGDDQDVVEIFSTSPAKLLNDDIFGRRDPCLSTKFIDLDSSSSSEALLMVRVITQAKQLNIKTRLRMSDHVAS